MEASWVPQTDFELPNRIHAAATVDGISYLITHLEPDYDTTVVECNLDGTYTHYSMGGSFGITLGSYAVVGTKIVLTGENSGSSTAFVYIFDTVAKTFSTKSIVTSPAINTPRWSKGALGPDGKVYFPPLRNEGSWATMKFLVYDPAGAGTLALTTLSGMWAAEGIWGAVMGGDGKMYFPPGWGSALGGTTWSSGALYVLDFGTMAITSIALPVELATFAPDGFYTSWAVPSPDGIFVMFRESNYVTRISVASGVDILAVGDPWHEDWANGSELTEYPEFYWTGIVGEDGKIYAVGSGYASSGNYPPVAVVIDPDTNVVKFQEWYDMLGEPFVASAVWPWDGGVRAAALYISSGGAYPPFLFVTYDTAGFSYALGALPVTLALGSTPVEARIG